MPTQWHANPENVFGILSKSELSCKYKDGWWSYHMQTGIFRGFRRSLVPKSHLNSMGFGHPTPLVSFENLSHGSWSWFPVKQAEYISQSINMSELPTPNIRKPWVKLQKSQDWLKNHEIFKKKSGGPFIFLLAFEPLEYTQVIFSSSYMQPWRLQICFIFYLKAEFFI